jgi:HTH-type transcriptional regulator/antitoxin HigA
MEINRKLDSIDIIKSYLNKRSLKDKFLVGIIGDKTTVSKVLNRKRKLSIRMVKRIHEATGISCDLLIR